MADISKLKGREKLNSHFPACHPEPTPEAFSYSRSVLNAPFTALTRVTEFDGQYPKKQQNYIASRCRIRKQVGFSNRWRYPEPLGSDLLGSAQAIRAISAPLNKSMLKIITAENPQLSINLDVTKPYKFRQSDDRLFTKPEGHGKSLKCSVSEPVIAIKASGMKSSSGRSTSLRKYIPTTARTPSPKELFLYHSRRGSFRPDVILRSLDMSWELHCPYIQKSGTLSLLLENALPSKCQGYASNENAQYLNDQIRSTNFYMTEEMHFRNKHKKMWLEGETGQQYPAVQTPRESEITVLELDIQDSLVTKEALAIALGSLYQEEFEVDSIDAPHVLAAADVLKIDPLKEFCADILLKTINYKNVCLYHVVASKYQQEQIGLFCERWLQLNLIPVLSSHIQLRELSVELFQKILMSNSLFTFNEYSVYKVLCYWIFLQLNPSMQLVPSHAILMAFFNSLPKHQSFSDTEAGTLFKPLFSAVRFHGITDKNHIQNLKLMNILPHSSLVDVLCQHYYSLQAGGDMFMLHKFENFAIRHGFIVDEEPRFHSEIMSIHGFFFELKGISKDDKHKFYMQRLKAGDPILSLRESERQTFSMRMDRLVHYSITVQYLKAGEMQVFTTGILNHKFGQGKKSSKSKVLFVDKKGRLYVTFALFLPRS